MNTPFTGQIVNLLAAILLLISFAMLSQRRIVSLIHLFAAQGVVLGVSTLIVAHSTSQVHLVYSALLNHCAQSFCSTIPIAPTDRATSCPMGHRATYQHSDNSLDLKHMEKGKDQKHERHEL